MWSSHFPFRSDDVDQKAYLHIPGYSGDIILFNDIPLAAIGLIFSAAPIAHPGFTHRETIKGIGLLVICIVSPDYLSLPLDYPLSKVIA